MYKVPDFDFPPMPTTPPARPAQSSPQMPETPPPFRWGGPRHQASRPPSPTGGGIPGVDEQPTAAPAQPTTSIGSVNTMPPGIYPTAPPMSGWPAQPPTAPRPPGVVEPTPPAASRKEKPKQVEHLSWKPVAAGALAGALMAFLLFLGVSSFNIGQDDTPGSNTTTATQIRGKSPTAGRVQEILDVVSPSVVTIYASSAQGEGAGTGVILDAQGYVITNAHVVEGADATEVDLTDGTSYKADIVGSVPEEDVAVLKLQNPPDDLVPAVMGSVETLEVGQEVVAIGNALDLGGEPTVTLGIVSGKNRSISDPTGGVLDHLLQTDAAINPGNSGGPLVDLTGKVVGINTAIIEDAQNIGFALSIDQVLDISKSLVDGVEPTLEKTVVGVQVVHPASLEPDVSGQFGVSVNDGAFVDAVDKDSGADKAGVKKGDVIVSVNGERVRSPEDLGRIIRDLSPGDTIKLDILRQGEEQTLTAVLGAG